MKILYHGGKEKFERFNYSMIGNNATEKGFGFYLTDNKEFAEKYGHDGYIMSFKFKGKKPLSSNKITITKEEMKRFLTLLNEAGGYLDNYGDVDWEGMNKVLNRAIESVFDSSEDDMDLIGGIINAYGNIEEPLDILYNELGYDHTIAKTDDGSIDIYVCFTNDCVEYIDVEKKIYNPISVKKCNFPLMCGKSNGLCCEECKLECNHRCTLDSKDCEDCELAVG